MSESVFNQAQVDADFRIEGDTAEHLFFADGGNDRVGVNTNSISSDATFGVNGNIELKSAGNKYWIPRASDGALTGSLYSRTGNNVTISGAGSSSGQIEFIPSSANSSAVALTIDSSQNAIFEGELEVKNGASRRISLNYEDSTNSIISHSGTSYGLESLNIRGDSITFYTDYDSGTPKGNVTLTLDNSHNATFAGVVTASGSTGSNYIGSFTNTSATGWGLFVKGGADNADYTLRVQDKDAADLLSVKAGGNIGIGTNDPSDQLTISNSGEASVAIIGSAGVGGGDATLYLVENSTSYGIRMRYDGGDDKLYINADEDTRNLMTIKRDGGGVGIGTTSPSEKLHVYGGSIKVEMGVGNDAVIDFKTTTTEYRIGCNIGGVGNDTFSIKDMQAGGGTERLRIKSDGDFIGSSSADISDEKMKKNITDLSDSLDKINNLKPVSFTWKEEAKKNTDKVYLGLLAQNVESQFPDVVTNESIMDTEDINYKSLHYTGLIAPLIKAVQELSAKVTALEGN